ncbi:MAG TPA: hypothetical protein VJX71_20290 [Methylomirabilota bacterium]|nr:hypothetical protein [Methylomirabilota bacterium]
MREIAFALEFKGRGGPVAGSPSRRQARTTAPSQILRTVLTASGITPTVEALPGESAVLESTVERFPDGTFVEDGTITYGRAGSISFDTVGRGHVGPAAGGIGSHGAVMWRITGGDGRFAGAQGLITSNFTVSPDGLVTDDHFTRLYLPE